MDKDAKEKLDELVLGLQGHLLEVCRYYEDANKNGKQDISHEYVGAKRTCSRAIRSVNGIFGTNYESADFTLQILKEYFAPKKKPCERQPPVAGKPEVI